MKISSRTRIIAFVLLLIIINVLAFSITLVDKGSYKNTLYYRFTRQRFAWIVSDLPPKYAIKAGWAKVNVTPNFKTPMANDKSAQRWTTVHDSIYTRAVVLDNGTTLAAIITIDLLIMPPSVALELQKRLPTLGFNWKNVYLGATNSHHSLGGWATDYMGKQTVGDYDEHVVSQLTEAILKAVALAKGNRATTQIGYTKMDFRDGEKSPPAENIHFLKLQKLTGESALICSSEGGQTGINVSTPSSLSRDYAGLLTDRLEQRTKSFTLFMVGAIEPPKGEKQGNKPAQDSKPANDTAKQIDGLLASITPLLANLPLHTDSTLIAQTTPLIQNDPQVRISQKWRLKPWLAKALYGDYPAELKALRIGKTVFIGYPGAFSSLLLPSLSKTKIAERNNLIITSFNGGNIGQIVPDTYYYAAQSPYQIRDINRFGPYTGAFVEDMAQSLVNSLK
ncbi:neutral/alkaline non-lysosomal ceramidase N-terminal domain-containing protein [Spirosoma flavum]|uniref:Neutral/alkaline non-lysosomal ceramidase N-terminal domain-containing protein n=1 Tax=Spirosoma flavum TaxID=2048557 RepID=A0ABW6ANK8_9BACT